MRAQNAIAGIDHALVGVRDLEAARAAWAALGFTITPRGRHIGWATGNYCIMFDRGYVELLGIVDPAGFTNDLDRFLAAREGLLGLALRSTDSERTAGWLAAAGLAPDGPKDLKRALELPEGTVMPAFKLVSVPPTATPGLKAFFCQHLTPELIRRPAWVVHANRAIALQAVVTVAERPADLAPAYARLFGDGAVRATAGSLSVDTGDGELLFATAAELGRLYPGIALPNVAPPWIAALRVGVPSIAETADYLDDKGVRTLATGRGIAVPPALATGAIVEFVPV